MYDIEVIDGHSYAVIEEGSNAYEFLKSMNSKLLMKKLASESNSPDQKIFLTANEVNQLCKGFKRSDLSRLVDVDLIELDFRREWSIETGNVKQHELYSFTEYGLEIVTYIKQNGGDVEIFLN